MIDPRHVGKQLEPSVLQVEAGRLAFFAKATGQAEAANTASLAPPTFIFAAEADSGALSRVLHEIGAPLDRVLHGEQSFTYHAPLMAGDTVTVRSRIADIYAKRALEFVVLESEASNQSGDLVAEMRSVLVVRS